MISVLQVPDEVVIGFFTATVVSLVAAVGVLWRNYNKNKPQ